MNDIKNNIMQGEKMISGNKIVSSEKMPQSVQEKKKQRVINVPTIKTRSALYDLGDRISNMDSTGEPKLNLDGIKPEELVKLDELIKNVARQVHQARIIAFEKGREDAK